ncbi:hypothetical protein HY638_04585 [Candidatus Woesearchaeota archaeon]|nr:hypothetical protein [Candidatus Woesearchaeota archaeon]
MKEISRRTYIIAGAITAVIFMLGVLLGLVVEGKRVAFVESQAKQQSLDFSSLQLQFEIVNELERENNCAALLATFNENVESLEKIRIRLESYEENAAINREEFLLLKREYLHAQLRYWLLAKKSKDLCGADVATVLYFFTNAEECPKCDGQAFVLTYLKKVFKERLLNFAFDNTLQNEPLLDMLKTTYNVTTFPSIVMNGKTFSGFTEKDVLEKEICGAYGEKPEECNGR